MPRDESPEIITDPVRAMTGVPAIAITAEAKGATFYFCSDQCRETFSAASGVAEPEAQPRDNAMYTCPMHPEVLRDYPGDCPECGMALEPMAVTASTADDDNVELREMTPGLLDCRCRDELAFRLGHRKRIAASAHETMNNALEDGELQ